MGPRGYLCLIEYFYLSRLREKGSKSIKNLRIIMPPVVFYMGASPPPYIYPPLALSLVGLHEGFAGVGYRGPRTTNLWFGVEILIADILGQHI